MKDGPVSCPRCGGLDAWPMEGCWITPENPTRECQACHHRWQHPGAELWPEDLADLEPET